MGGEGYDRGEWVILIILRAMSRRRDQDNALGSQLHYVSLEQ
jgi:hypothetical protein